VYCLLCSKDIEILTEEITLPPDRPLCGFHNELCPEDNSGNYSCIFQFFSAASLNASSIPPTVTYMLPRVVCPSVCICVCLCVCMSVTLVHPAKAAGQNEMPFGRDTCAPSKIVLDRGPGLPRKGEIWGSDRQFAGMPLIAKLLWPVFCSVTLL